MSDTTAPPSANGWLNLDAFATEEERQDIADAALRAASPDFVDVLDWCRLIGEYLAKLEARFDAADVPSPTRDAILEAVGWTKLERIAMVLEGAAAMAHGDNPHARDFEQHVAEFGLEGSVPADWKHLVDGVTA